MQELTVRYTAAVEVVAEKTMQTQELQSDLADVKEMFSKQVQELLERMDALKNNRP